MELRTSNVVHRVYISLSPTGHEAAGGEILMSMHVARKRFVIHNVNAMQLSRISCSNVSTIIINKKYYFSVSST